MTESVDAILVTAYVALLVYSMWRKRNDSAFWSAEAIRERAEGGGHA